MMTTWVAIVVVVDFVNVNPNINDEEKKTK